MDHVWNLIVWLVVVVVRLHHHRNRSNRRDVPGNYRRYVACRESWRLISHLETMAIFQYNNMKKWSEHSAYVIAGCNEQCVKEKKNLPSAHLPYWHWSSLVDFRIGIFYICQRMELVLRECGASKKKLVVNNKIHTQSPIVKNNRWLHNTPYLSATLRHSRLCILWHQSIQPLIYQLSPYSLQS